jgi:hypothetical protein
LTRMTKSGSRPFSYQMVFFAHFLPKICKKWFRQNPSYTPEYSVMKLIPKKIRKLTWLSSSFGNIIW